MVDLFGSKITTALKLISVFSAAPKVLNLSALACHRCAKSRDGEGLSC